jgi:hypothetical protein
MRAWTESDERRVWLDRVKPLVLDEFKETVLTGLERWFTLPTKPGLAPPPAYKMAIVTAAVVYPLSLGLSTLLARWLAAVPAPARSLVGCIVMITLMTWVIMPRVTRLLRFWLFP